MSGAEDRRYWLETLDKVARPVLAALAERRLKALMPVEGKTPDRPQYTRLEALGRTLAGLAPWLALPAPGAGPDAAADPATPTAPGAGLTADEASLQAEYRHLAQAALDAATDPASPDFLNFSHGNQPIVDAAFLAHALLRAPEILWSSLESRVQRNVAAALKATRIGRKPAFNNWLLFAAMIEAALCRMGEEWDHMRVDFALKQHEQWYLGDGVYADGPHFHWDYYNSFVIQPMLLDVLTALRGRHPDWDRLLEPAQRRAQRYAAIQERLIAPDGSYPPIGRSIAYRCGAFQHLAQAALQHRLPAEISPQQVRGALTAVIRRTLSAPGTFDEQGWLTIGLCGHQPGLGEGYISTGSLYLCTTAFLPLGLPPSDPFWSNPPAPWSAQRLWAGEDLPADHASA